MKPIISLIAAIDEYRGLGKNNQLLFKISEDQKRFREITKGHVVIMGRKTFESIGRPLPNRTNILITRDQNYQAEGCLVVYSLDEALEKASEIEHDEIFVIGGGEIYKQAIEKADKLYLTIVKGTHEADTFFPEYSAFQNIELEEKKNSEGFEYKFINLTRD